ncbi:MAG TPA: hypothetical protein VLH85_10245, partial [Levilinea sp.]|nr:hypothetical protein [Levilinea sp.]
DRKMGWTVDFLEECRQSQIDADIASMAEDATDAWVRSIWTRFFQLEEQIGRRFGLGATGVSVPFANGGVGTIPFVPVPKPDRMINAFNAAHTHYLRLNGITQANLVTAVAHLWEHGHDGPYDLIVSLADVAAWQTVANVTGFVPKGDSLVQYGSAATLANVGAEYIGGVQTQYGFCRMYALGRLPTTYWGVTKFYGPLDQRNPLKIRWDDKFGLGVKLYTEQVSLYPLNGAIGVIKHGVGIGEDRTAAVLVLNAAGGNYVTPVIS